MARSLNKVTLIGRLGRDPEMRYTASGTAVCTFTLATNRFRQGQDGSPQEDTDWHTVVTWDKLAETCNQFLSKGRLVYVEGALQTRSWEQDGQKRYKTEVVAREMIILDTKDRGEQFGGNGHGREALVPVGADADADDLPF
jgi:single-strand DNA-binding protein